VAVFQSIVVGDDGSETAELAVDLAAQIARESNAVLHVVTAAREAGTIAAAAGGLGLPAGTDLAGRLLAEEEAAKAVAMLTSAGVDARAHVSFGDPAEVILEVAKEVSADLIVVGSKGMHGARRVLGSVPNTVAHAAHCAVLIAKTT
jgi:nucleotide-binding universal stress UspA family protein